MHVLALSRDLLKLIKKDSTENLLITFRSKESKRRTFRYKRKGLRLDVKYAVIFDQRETNKTSLKIH